MRVVIIGVYLTWFAIGAVSAYGQTPPSTAPDPQAVKSALGELWQGSVQREAAATVRAVTAEQERDAARAEVAKLQQPQQPAK